MQQFKQPVDGERKKVVTILVTGFSEFQDGAGPNPSHIITSLLPVEMKTSPADPTPVKLVTFPYPIPTAYKQVRNLVPNIFAAYEKEVDIVLHIGMAVGETHYSLERRAHRDGYHELKDVMNETLPERDGEVFWKDLPPTLDTSLDFDDVYARWRMHLLDTPDVSPELNGVRIRSSSDAGHFLCDFIYYSMLAEYRQKRKSSEGDINSMPVIFMHVPSGNTKEDIKKGVLVVRALVHSLAESFNVTSSVGHGPR